MPYVKKEQRKDLDVIVNEALEIYNDSGRLYWDYILVKLVERFISPGYKRYRNFLAEVTESVFEMRRRFDIHSRILDVYEEEVFIPNDFTFVKLNKFVEKLACLNIDGDLNYILFAFGVRAKKDRYRSYISLEYVKQLEHTVRYIREKMLAPYEDKKIKENGDVK